MSAVGVTKIERVQVIVTAVKHDPAPRNPVQCHIGVCARERDFPPKKGYVAKRPSVTRLNILKVAQTRFSDRGEPYARIASSMSRVVVLT